MYMFFYIVFVEFRVLPDSGNGELIPFFCFQDYSTRTTLIVKGAEIFVGLGVDPKESA